MLGGDFLRRQANRMARQLRSRSNLQSGNGIRVHHSVEGSVVIAERRGGAFRGSFGIRLAGGLRFSCEFGAVGGIVPQIQGVSLDGKNGRGDKAAVPVVQMESGPNEQMRSWACLQVALDPASRSMIEQGQDMPTIVHRNDVHIHFKNGYWVNSEDNLGCYPLAMFVWRNETSVEMAHQIVFFNQRHFFRPASGSGMRGGHYFAPVK